MRDMPILTFLFFCIWILLPVLIVLWVFAMIAFVFLNKGICVYKSSSDDKPKSTYASYGTAT